MEFGHSTLAFRSPFGANNGIAGHMLLEGGTPRQREEHLPWLARGEWTASLALTEPEAGSHPSTLATLAYGDGRDRVITGRKQCIANAPHANVTFAPTQPGTPPARASRHSW